MGRAPRKSMGAFLEKPITEKHTTATHGNGLASVPSSMQGWRVAMEDAHIQVHKVGSRSDINLFGVFDGHGGSFAAQYVENKLHDKLVNTDEWRHDSTDPNSLCAALKAAALSLDEDLRKQAIVASGEDRSGTTAVFGLVTPSHIIIANIGDSRCVLATGGNTKPMSFDHKPTNPGEQKRIEKAGGSVTLSRVNGDLAVSRALGDFSYKQCSHLPAEQQQVSPEPEFEVWQRSSKDEFLVLACDGIWDVMENEDTTAYFRETLSKMPPQHACENLLEECLNRKSRDNMTVVLVIFES